MTNIEKLENSNLKADKVLLNFIHREKVENLINAQNMGKSVNRGDCFEMCLTHKPTLRTGKHEQSHGDIVINGEPFEIKYLTKKTGASIALQGTSAKYHIIGFNTGAEIVLKKILTSQLKVRNGKITYQDNF